MRMRTILPVLLATILATGAGAYGDMVFTGASGSRAASANFHTAGSSVVVTLTNTSTADVMDPTGLLTALFFTLPTGVSLTPTSALLPGGSTVYYGSNGGGNLGGEWAYGAGLSGAPLGATRGISSSGLGLFGSGNFNGPNLDPPANGALDGPGYGITSAGDVMTTGNKTVTGDRALIKNSVVFTLAFAGSFDPSQISHLSFQYGTDLAEPNVPGNPPTPVPVPAAAGLGALGLAMVGWVKRRAA